MSNINARDIINISEDMSHAKVFVTDGRMRFNSPHSQKAGDNKFLNMNTSRSPEPVGWSSNVKTIN